MMKFETWLEAVLLGDPEEIELDDKRRLNNFVTRMNREIDRIIQSHGPNVVGEAIWYVYGSSSGYMWDVADPNLGEFRFEFMESVKTLYADGFAAHCVNWSRGGSQSSLHSACYMLWDMDGIECWAFNGDRDMLAASLDILQFALNLDSPACQESALHGLGHLAFKYKREIEPIVDCYLQSKKPIGVLREYAQAARSGCLM